MKILLSNDDGYKAEGLRCLLEKLNEYFNDIVVVAPEKNQSGVSNALSLKAPLRVFAENSDIFYVDGTPSDCVHLALTGYLKDRPDLVIAGINDAPNLGDDVLYSGTVAAAMEARLLDMPSFAISIVSDHKPKNFSTAARVMLNIILSMDDLELNPTCVYNINVPDIPYDQLSGYQVTRLGSRKIAGDIIKTTAPNSHDTIYWVGPQGGPDDNIYGTDFYAVNNGFVSITPIHFDMTSHNEKLKLENKIDLIKND